MDASALALDDGVFDAVVCVQNGICAFGVDRVQLVREALRVARPGGLAMFSTYAEGFWSHRLDVCQQQQRRHRLPCDHVRGRGCSLQYAQCVLRYDAGA
jgi:SAM-dependent methyltransferase